jgi:hypothetical protein
MPPILHVTNGTAIVPLMREAGITGPIIPWDDVLHEGPVPIGLNSVALRERRAEFLASCGWGPLEQIRRSLETRDRTLDAATGRGEEVPRTDGHFDRADEIVLWFEHDLFDQLQLIQILHRLPMDGLPRVTAVPADDYLGRLPADSYQAMFAARREVSSAARLAARDAWTAFRSPDPRALMDVLPRVGDLPHLEAALGRHLEQFPSTFNGLSRTERQAVEVVSAGTALAGDVYRAAHHEREAAVFMGDAAFLMHIEALLAGPRPLLARDQPAHRRLSLDDRLTLTDDGRLVLSGVLDRVRACGIQRWLGGVELSGTGPTWRWDPARGLRRQ